VVTKLNQDRSRAPGQVCGLDVLPKFSPMKLLQILAVTSLLSNCAMMETDPPQSRLCEVHKIPLAEKTGYAPSQGTYADPSMDYINSRRRSEYLYPHLSPWYLSERSKTGWEKKEKVLICPQCEIQFDKAYSTYRAQKSLQNKSIAGMQERVVKNG